MNNPIPHFKLFATRDLKDIQADMDRLPPTQKALVYQFVMATLNACHALVEEEILELT